MSTSEPVMSRREEWVPFGSEMAAPTLTCASARREGLLLPSELLGDTNKDCVFIMI